MNCAAASTQTLATHDGSTFSMRRRRPEVALSANEIEFADAYLQFENPKAHDWAQDLLWKAESPDERLKLVMTVIQRARLPEHEAALGSLGAGDMEDLMSEWLLDRLKDYLPFSQNLRYCLSMVRMEFEPNALQQRLNRMRGVH